MPKSTAAEMPEQIQMSLGEHLAELRTRLLWAGLALAVTTGASLILSRTLMAFLLRPIAATYFYGPGEALAAHLRIALLIGVPLAWPVVLYQLYAFAAPGLYPHERRALIVVLPAGSCLFLLGLVFGYVAMVPLVLLWLRQFAVPGVRPAVSVTLYTSFVVNSILPFGIAFQLPLVVGVLARMGLLTARALAASRRWVLLGIVTVAAVLTPPDVLSQLAMSAPMIVLFELAVIVARFTGRRRPPEDG